MNLLDNFKPGAKDRNLCFLIAVVLLIRLISMLVMGPMPQDAYYFFYSQHPSLSYFDHPPAIAWLLKFFTTLFGKHVFAIKLADSFLTLLTTLAVYKLALIFHSKSETKKVLLLFLSTLMVSILSLISTPDTPLLFCWAVTLILLHRAIFGVKRKYWIYAGIAMGLAFDSKYSAVFLPAGMGLFLLLSSSKRKWLYTIWPWLSGLVMVMVSFPVIYWNVENHFASFAFQGAQRMHSVSAFQLKPAFLFGLIGHQLALLGPVLFISLFYGLYQLIKKKPDLPVEKLFLLSFFLPVFLLFLCLSPIYWIKINWMMPAYVTGIIWVSTYISEKWVRVQVIFSFILHLAFAIEIFFYPVAVRSDDTWVGWSELSKQVESVKARTHADFIFSADNYKTSSELNLMGDEFVYGQNVIGENALHYDFIGTNLQALNGKSAIYIDSQPRFDDEGQSKEVPGLVLPYFKTVVQLNPILIKRNGKVVRKFLVYLCQDYTYKKID